MVSAKPFLRRKFVTDKLPQIPGWSALTRTFENLAQRRVGPHPVGLLTLVPVAVAIDIFDFLDEGLPVVGTVASFFVQTAYLTAVTGKPTAALGFSAIDLIPGLDIIPMATIATVRQILAAYREAPREAGVSRPTGPVIDV
ncbi:MAG TPA: hypothetical protein VNZ52_14630 [Candidatus Thermoplasmatota archaeon]|nr:hypothetical protein [Candidatus Thermoplasmatota archaeon]